VDVKEIQQIEAYLKKLFGNARIRVTPQKGDAAAVLLGEDAIGELTADDDDDERSYNLRMEIPIGESTGGSEDIKRLDVYLKRKFDNEKLRVVGRPRKKDSVEAYLGEEFIGVLFIDDQRGGRTYIFEMPILSIDLNPEPI
jgi:hypothetical protein